MQNLKQRLFTLSQFFLVEPKLVHFYFLRMGHKKFRYTVMNPSKNKKKYVPFGIENIND